MTSNQDSRKAPFTPKNEKDFYVYAAVLLIVLFVMTMLCFINGIYGWTLFIGIPFCIGLTIGYFNRKYRHKNNKKVSLNGIKI